MRASTPAFAAAVGTPDTQPVTSVVCTWPAGFPAVPAISAQAVESCTPAGSLTTDMPAGTKLITGYPAQTAQLVLSGMVGKDETQSAQWLFDPYSPTSPLYGLDWTGLSGVLIVVNQGLQLPGVPAPEMFDQFTGYVDKYQINRATGQVTLTLVDTRAQISNTPTLPMVFADNNAYQSWMAPGLTGLWPIDYLLRANGIYSTPAPRAGCVFYLSGHGSLYPEIFGTISQASADTNVPPTPVTWTAGKFAGQIPTSANVVATTASALNDGLGGGHYVEFWMTSDTVPRPAPSVIGTGHMRLTISADYTTGKLSITSASVTRNGTLYAAAIPNGSAVGFGPHHVGVQLTYPTATSARIQVYFDNNPVAANDVMISGLPAAVPGDATSSNITLSAYLPIEGLQVTTETAAVPTPASWTGQADLDASLNNLTAIPTYTAGDAWQLLQQIVEAEFAVAGFDGTRFFFRNRYNYPTAAQATVTSLRQVKDIQLSVSEATRARTVTALAHPLAPSAPAVIWQAANFIKIAPSSTITLFASLQSPAGNIPTAFLYYPTGGLVPPFTVNGYRAAYTRDYGHAVTNLVLTATQISSTTVLVSIRNPNGFSVSLVDNTTGQPSLALVGQVASVASVTGVGVLNSDGSVTVSASYGSGVPSLALTDSPWRQDPDATQLIVDDQLSDLVRPRALIDQLVIVGDPRLRLGDRVQVQDRGELANYVNPAVMADDVILIGISGAISPGEGFTQTIVARTVAAPRQWILGQPGRSELGSTTWI